MGMYAVGTDVPVERSRAEIEKVLSKYGATQFVSGTDSESGKAMIHFKAARRCVRFILPLPDINSKEFQYAATNQWDSSKKLRTPEKAYKAWEQACRAKWRALCLCIKAKLEAVACGITEFDEEFLAHIVLPDQKTIGYHLKPQLDASYDTGKMPSLLMLESPNGKK